MDKKGLAKMLKQGRVMIPLTLRELSARAGVSASHLDSIEGGRRSPSARVLHKIAGPLGLSEEGLFALAGFLSPQPSTEVEGVGRLDAYVADVLSQEPMEIQRAVVTILSVLKSLAKGFQDKSREA